VKIFAKNVERVISLTEAFESAGRVS
jgi:hypothetical protein